MRVKKKSFKKVFAVFTALFVLLCACLCLFPRQRKSVDTVSAALTGGFEDNGVSNPDISVQFVLKDGTVLDAINIGLNAGYNGVLVKNGISVGTILDAAGFSQYRGNIGWIYLALTFPMGNGRKSFPIATHDLYVSDFGAVSEFLPIFDDGTAALSYVEELVEPLPAMRYYRIQIYQDSLIHSTDLYWVGSMSFRFLGVYFENMMDLWYLNLSDYFIFSLPKGYFSSTQDAYNQGFEAGSAMTREEFYQAGYDEGYGYGYDVGFNKGSENYNLFYGLFAAAIDVPVSSFVGMLDFNIFGVNMATFAISIISLALVLTLVRKFI